MGALEISNVVAGAGVFFFDGTNTYATSSPGFKFERLGVGLVRITCDGANPQPFVGSPPATPTPAAFVGLKVAPLVNVVGPGYVQPTAAGEQSVTVQTFNATNAPADLPLCAVFFNW